MRVSMRRHCMTWRRRTRIREFIVRRRIKQHMRRTDSLNRSFAKAKKKIEAPWCVLQKCLAVFVRIQLAHDTALIGGWEEELVLDTVLLTQGNSHYNLTWILRRANSPPCINTCRQTNSWVQNCIYIQSLGKSCTSIRVPRASWTSYFGQWCHWYRRLVPLSCPSIIGWHLLLSHLFQILRCIELRKMLNRLQVGLNPGMRMSI